VDGKEGDDDPDLSAESPPSPSQHALSGGGRARTMVTVCGPKGIKWKVDVNLHLPSVAEFVLLELNATRSDEHTVPFKEVVDNEFQGWNAPERKDKLFICFPEGPE
jgi:hypothetical protein